jgi:hypothetical protein
MAALRNCNLVNRATGVGRGCVKTPETNFVHGIFGHVGSIALELLVSIRLLSNPTRDAPEFYTASARSSHRHLGKVFQKRAPSRGSARPRITRRNRLWAAAARRGFYGFRVNRSSIGQATRNWLGPCPFLIALPTRVKVDRCPAFRVGERIPACVANAHAEPIPG